MCIVKLKFNHCREAGTRFITIGLCAFPHSRKRLLSTKVLTGRETIDKSFFAIYGIPQQIIVDAQHKDKDRKEYFGDYGAHFLFSQTLY